MIYICIPSYNEAATVGVLLWKIRRVMAEFPREYHLLVLDDGSTDGTADVLDPYMRVLPLTVLRNGKRTGYTASVERLIREAVERASHPKRDVVVMLQADFTEAPEDIPLLVKRVEGGADVVTAMRDEASVRPPLRQRWSSRALSWLLRRTPLTDAAADPLEGFRAYRVAVLKRALTDRNGAALLSRAGRVANAELLMAVAAHARRTEVTTVASRQDLRQRETRQQPWRALVEVWNFSRDLRSRGQPLPHSESS